MRTLRRLARIAAVAIVIVLAYPTRPAHGQILRRLRDHAEDAAARAAVRAAEERLRDSQQAAAQDATAQPSAPGTAAADANLPAVGGGSGAGGTVDFRTLRDLLPADFAGFTRTNATGQRSSAMGFATSRAEGTYAQGDARATVTITDMGTMRTWAALGAAWMNVELDNETETGYERTLRYHEMPARVQEDRSAHRAEMTVVVAERFLVEAEVQGRDARSAQAALDAVDFARLTELAGPAVRAVDAATLGDWLPATLAGTARTAKESSQTQIGGYSAIEATGHYGTDTEAITVTVTDYAGGVGLVALVWTNTTFDNRTDAGFERTARIATYPAQEREHRDGDTVSSSIEVAVAGRFRVEVRGDVPYARLRAAVDTLDLAALAALAR